MSNEPWHLSRSVPITFIFAIFLQTVALIWFVATLRNDVNNNTTEIVRIETRTAQLEQAVQGQAITLARIDENLKIIRDAIENLTKN